MSDATSHVVQIRCDPHANRSLYTIPERNTTGPAKSTSPFLCAYYADAPARRMNSTPVPLRKQKNLKVLLRGGLFGLLDGRGVGLDATLLTSYKREVCE